MSKIKEQLTQKSLFSVAKEFCDVASKKDYPELLGITDGKAIGTFIEHKLKEYLQSRYKFKLGNSASGIDLPEQGINTDIKVTSIRQPQSSCPYKSSRQKIFGLGYNLLVLVYNKKDLKDKCKLEFLNCTFISEERTADFTTTRRLLEMLKDGGNKEDIISYLLDRNIPGDELTIDQIADEILEHGIVQGYLTISNALQWRLQYQRVISLDNKIDGITNYDF